MTKFLADENIPIKAVEALRQKGIDIVPIQEISPGLSDREVLEFANKQGRVIITFDTDFGKFAFKEKLEVKGIVFLTFSPISPQHIAGRIGDVLTTKTPIENYFPVVREDSVRVFTMRQVSAREISLSSGISDTGSPIALIMKFFGSLLLSHLELNKT